MTLEIRTANDERGLFLEVLSAHWVMSLATFGEEGPYSTPVFYAVADQGETLVFVSEMKTKHIRQTMRESRAAASVFLETKEIGVLRGVQVCGWVELLEGEEKLRLEEIYYRTHPVAKLYTSTNSEVTFFAFRVQSAKLTDNRLGFGNHIVWEFRER